MHRSLAKQDTLVANVIVEIIPLNEIPPSCISLTNPQSHSKFSIIELMAHRFPRQRHWKYLENWRLLKTLSNHYKLSYKFCAN
jgi:hypothetical protein